MFALSLGLLGAYFEDDIQPKGYTLKTWMRLWKYTDSNKTNKGKKSTTIQDN
jgi:hypothetical protein